MADPTDVVAVGDDGSVEALDPKAQSKLAEYAGQYRLTAAPGLLLLRRTPEGDTGGMDPVIMAGEITSSMTLFHMIGIIAERNWQGQLQVVGAEGSERSLFFDQGALKYARSNQHEDRLGEFLLARGVLSRLLLSDLLRDVTPDKRFGQVCLDRGILDQEELFLQLGEQTKTMFFRTLLVSSGSYVFGTPDDTALPPTHTVHVPVRGLLMEGVQRIDEMALFRERIPASSMCPEAIPGKSAEGMDEDTLMVLSECTGQHPIEEIARRTGLGEFHTTKAVYHLIQAGKVKLHTGTDVDDDAVRRVTETFSGVMRDIFAAVAAHGDAAPARTMLGAWIEASGYQPYFGQLADDGGIDVDSVLEALQSNPEEHPLEVLHQVFHELVSFALFCALSALPREEELQLSRDVNRRLQEIKMA